MPIEILMDTREEIQDLGFENALVDPVGGAFVRFDDNRSIEVYGISDEFGGCDKQAAADLIRQAFPERPVLHRSIHVSLFEKVSKKHPL